ncbi:MAG: hypothetical protein BWY11_00289 [Firmicutes bacterium ADurb.Bin182]|nr:MAG: hypothetical protein BWY11_00289 [Firmicutes bacterium ADurb.Bin182]
MKTFANGNPKHIALLMLLTFVCALVLVNALGYFLDLKYLSIFAAARQADKCEIRSALLIEAMDGVGVCNPYDAPNIWAKGLKKRNAAMQYSVLSNKLKNPYKKQLEKTFPNWVTGVSSPWVEDVTIAGAEKPAENEYVFDLKVYTMTSAGPAGEYDARLTVSLEDGFWRISDIDMDKELEVYTGFDFR